MQEELHQNIHAVMLGQRGGQVRAARLSAEQRSAISRHAARARWHPLQVQAEKEKAQEIAYLAAQILKGKQLPLI
jgi:hypothetical protein